ncbi:MAG: peptidyl-prolyl cis-trans isomerase [Acidobacteriaceae bacterium]|jgi:peptidyl-prolyl cis-trans isomerase SurA|nr:peptidyl-prolyl cis-trans isomerase [Acidobacteriaceae bacterium]
MKPSLRVAAGTLAVFAALTLSLRAEIVEQILVKVNGEIFTKSDLEVRQIAALRQMGQQTDTTSDAQLQKMLNDVTPQLIVSAIDETLLVQRGHELGYKMGDDQFKSVLDSIKKDNKIETDEQFQQALKSENLTLPELRRNLERQWIITRVQQNEVLGKVSVSDDELRRYYDEHRSEFTSQPSVTLREIFVSLPNNGANATVADDNLTRTRATELRRRAVSGEDFASLASAFSDAASKSNAGLIGPLNLSDLSEDVRKLLAPMKPGDITDVLRGARGYQILKLESLTGAQTATFEQAHDQIGDKVFNEKRRIEFERYLERARAQAIIEWKSDDLKKAYEQGLLQADTQATSDK